MDELPTNAAFGPFHLNDVLGRGPGAVVYRATRTSDRKPVALKIFNAGGDDSLLRRIEDDTRRLIGLSHPHILRVDSVGREGSRLYIASELFEGRSLRTIGSRPLPDLAQLLLKAARGLGAAWMRLILHRNLKPENVLVSVAGDLKLCDFGQFRDATPYWAPERKAGRSADLRGDLYSLGTVFKEILPGGDPDLDALLQKMTHAESFERVQMVEDVISRLEAWTGRHPAAATPSAPPPPPSPEFRPAPPTSWQPPDPALTDARTTLVSTLAAVRKRIERSQPPEGLVPFSERPKRIPPPAPPPKIEMPVFMAPPPPPRIEIAPPPRPRHIEPYVPPPPLPPVKPRRSGSLGVLKTLVVMACIGGFLFYQSHLRTVQRREREEAERVQQAQKEQEARRRQAKAPADKKKPLTKPVEPKAGGDGWENSKAVILGLGQEGKHAEALKECERYLEKHAQDAPPEAAQLRKSLKDWVATVTQAEQSWKYGGDKRAADLLARAGPDRAKDAQRLLAAWCEQDWEKVKVAVDKAINENDTETAKLEVDRFLRKVHLGGPHKKEAEELQRQFQADIDYSDLADRVNTLKSRAPAEAAAALEAFLAKPHRGGTHREDVQKQITKLQEEAERLLYSGRASINKMTVSPESRRVLFTSDGIHIMEIENRDHHWTLPQRSLLRGLASGGGGEEVAVATSSKVSVWSLTSKTENRSFAPAEGFIVGVAMHGYDKVYIAISDGSLVTWDPTKEEAPKIEKDVAPGAISMTLGGDYNHLAFASRDRTIRVRQIDNGQTWKFPGPPVSMSALAMDPDGKTVAAGSANGMVTLWKVASGEAGPSAKAHTGTVTCADFSGDGSMLATGGADAVIRISSPKDGSEIMVLKGHQGRVTSVAFLGKNLISSGADGTVRVWPLK